MRRALNEVCILLTKKPDIALIAGRMLHMYVVYKRHKGEFYDAHKKEWTTSHISLDRYNYEGNGC